MAAPAKRVALVTGGGRGIGREIALALAREGCAVAVAARTMREVEEAAAAVRLAGPAGLAVPLDVTDPAAVGRVVARVADTLGPVDVLVGITRLVPRLRDYGNDCAAGPTGACDRGRGNPFPPRWARTARARMEPSRTGAADACRVVPRPLAHAPVGPVWRSS